MDAARGGMPAPPTCMLPFLNLTLTIVVFCHCWNNVDASSLLYEPPYEEPSVRWCGRTAEVTPPPTRSNIFYEGRLQRAAPTNKYSKRSCIESDQASLYGTA